MRAGVFGLVALSATFAISGCASNSGIRDVGGGNFFVSRQAATGFSGMGTLRADALEEAAQHCRRTNQAVEVISEDETEPPYIFGKFPRIDMTFRCV